jgi:hypothetical protein
MPGGRRTTRSPDAWSPRGLRCGDRSRRSRGTTSVTGSRTCGVMHVPTSGGSRVPTCRATLNVIGGPRRRGRRPHAPSRRGRRRAGPRLREPSPREGSRAGSTRHGQPRRGWSRAGPMPRGSSHREPSLDGRTARAARRRGSSRPGPNRREWSRGGPRFRGASRAGIPDGPTPSGLNRRVSRCADPSLRGARPRPPRAPRRRGRRSSGVPARSIARRPAGRSPRNDRSARGDRIAAAAAGETRVSAGITPGRSRGGG